MWLNLGRKTVFVNINPLLLVWSKKLFNQTQIFLRICPLSNMVRKTNFLSFSVLVSEIVNFLTKKRSSPWISPKILQNNRKAEFSCMWLNLGRKTVFVNIYPLLMVWSITFVLTNPNFTQDFTLFKHGKNNKLSEYFSARFCDSHFSD